MKKWILLLLGVLLIMTGCSFYERETQSSDADEFVLYFRERDLSAAAGEGALRAERAQMSELPSHDAQAAAEALVAALLKGPRDESLKNTIPAGTALMSLKLDGTRATVDLSAPYGTLSGIALTLADQAIALTLTQLPEILTVKITVHGRELNYRDKQLFSGRDVLLAPEGDVVSTVEAVLYFLNEDGILASEERVLELYEGDTQVSAVIRAVENGPEDKELTSVLPAGFRIKSGWLEEATCYVNLSSGHLESIEEEQDLQMAVDAIAKALCSLDAVQEVRFLVDGDFARRYGTADVSKVYMD